MQRTLLIALATAVVAAGIATTATILLTDNDDPTSALASPSASPSETVDVQTASPDASASAEPDGTEAPSATPAAGSTATPEATDDEIVSAISSTDELTADDDRVLDSFEEAPDPKSTSGPTITMDSAVWDKDKEPISEGETLSSIHVEVVVSNSTKETFHFAKREIVLEIFRDGKAFDSFATKGSSFDMTPGSEMTGTFDRPITKGGHYTWRAKVSYS